MDNNDILRRVRYMLDLSDSKMIKLFGLADYTASRAEVSDWLKKDDDPAYQKLSDNLLAIFLNGLIVDKRGKREGDQPVPEEELTNNIVFKKLKIAFDMKADDIIEVFSSVDVTISAHELSAFMRNPKQSQYRLCNDQYLRNFINGLQLKYRKSEEA
ncbi:MAG: DUF1456 family protein [Bacteroidales bacterium]|nr:DUF1456 family protein [Bacteroidales bacterium]